LCRRSGVSQVPELIQHGEARDPGQSSLSRQVAKCDAVDQASQFEIPNYTRVDARVTVSKGQGSCGTLAFSRIRRAGSSQSELRKAILARFDSVAGLDRIISTHLLEANPTLSNSQGEASRQPGSGDWYVVVEGTDAGAVQWAGDQH